MKNEIKLMSTAILGSFFWILIIVLSITVAKSDFKDSTSSKQLVSGLISIIVILFLFKLGITLKIIFKKEKAEYHLIDKLLIYWGMISGDFLFGVALIWRNYFKK